MEAFADDDFNVAQILTFVSATEENIVKKRNNTIHQDFVLLPQRF